jgi:cytochrome P450
VISALLASEYFETREEELIDELITFYFGSKKTLQVGIVNFIYYVTKHPHVKDKLMSELDKPGCSEYLQMCWQETLRIEPPVAATFPWTVRRECTLSSKTQSFKVTPGTQFAINIEAMHHDPAVWVEPNRFEPERFNPCSEPNKWTFAPSGKARNPLAFTPFLAGQRACAGK